MFQITLHQKRILSLLVMTMICMLELSIQQVGSLQKDAGQTKIAVTGTNVPGHTAASSILPLQVFELNLDDKHLNFFLKALIVLSLTFLAFIALIILFRPPADIRAFIADIISILKKWLKR